jgi:hypothetical protein
MSEGLPALIAARFDTSRANVSHWTKAGMPLASMDEAIAWLKVNRPKLFSTLLDDSIESAGINDVGPRGAYARARALERKAYKQAIDEPTPQAILAHSKAASSAAAMAEAVAEWEVKSGSVADVATMQAAWVKFFATLRAELDSMPIRLGEKVPGSEPELTEWVRRTLTRLERCQPFGPGEDEEGVE